MERQNDGTGRSKLPETTRNRAHGQGFRILFACHSCHIGVLYQLFLAHADFNRAAGYINVGIALDFGPVKVRSCDYASKNNWVLPDWGSGQ
jgi:hypothetical protein